MHILKDILTYAYRGSGKYILLTCVLLWLIADVAGASPVLGGIASLLMSGYFCAVYFQLIQSTATGGKETPDFPDISNVFEDIIWPMLQILVVALVSFGPVVGYMTAYTPETGNEWVALGLLGAGIVYFPMAMLGVVVLGRLSAVSPHIVLPAIFRAGWIYWVGVVMLGILYGVSTLVEEKLHGQLIVSHLVMAVVGSYVMITNARILGVVYRERQEELNWL